MGPERLEYEANGNKPRKASVGWGVVGLLCLPAGFFIAGYGGLGALFVAGGLERGEAGASWGGVCFLVAVALVGVAMMVGGVALMVMGAGTIERARYGEAQRMRETECSSGKEASAEVDGGGEGDKGGGKEDKEDG